jgi:hypothetical protein
MKTNKMKRMHLFKAAVFIPVMLLFATMFTGCEIIGDIFKAGIWVGVIIVIAIIAVIAFVVKMFK